MTGKAADLASHRVVILVLPDVVALDLAVPLQVFGRWPPYLTSGELRNPYQTSLCGAGPTASFGNGLTATALQPLAVMRGADTIVVPGCVDPLAVVSRTALRELAAAAARGARVISICTGAFVLAEAGLLDGRPATTHWRWAPELRRRHPLVDVQEQHLYVDDGQVLTSAGVLAGTDLCLHVVRRDIGQTAANELARFLVSPPHREGGQAQYISRPVPAPDGSLAQLRQSLSQDLGRHHTLTTIARQANLSVRTLTRRFQQETDQTVGEWLTAQRVSAARALLETSSEPVAAVADRLGFGSAESLRTHFQHALGTSPHAYRQAFRLERSGPSDHRTHD